jgi:hypothetical protein
MTSYVKFDKWLSTDGSPRNAVIQTVEYFKTASMTISCPSGNSWYDVSGFNATITPKYADSKILLMCTLNWASGYWEHAGRFTRNGTVIGVGQRPSPYNSSAPQAGFCNNKGMAHDNGRNNVYTSGYTFLDSPATTSAVTYQLQVSSYNGYSVYLNRSYYYTDSSDHESTKVCSLILMEIQQ